MRRKASILLLIKIYWMKMNKHKENVSRLKGYVCGNNRQTTAAMETGWLLWMYKTVKT